MSEKILKFRGGHRLGNFNVTIPLASLQVSKNKLLIRSPFASAELKTSEVIEIKEVIYFPFIGQGIKIVHNKPDLANNVIFWSMKNPESLIEAIKQTGFLPEGQ